MDDFGHLDDLLQDRPLHGVSHSLRCQGPFHKIRASSKSKLRVGSGLEVERSKHSKAYTKGTVNLASGIGSPNTVDP